MSETCPIERITQTNFARAVQIVDWSHGSGRVWDVGKAVLGEGKPETLQWVAAHLDQLWSGGVSAVISVLEGLEPKSTESAEIVRQATVYFRNQAPRMRYAEFRAAGYPIGSGTVECGKHGRATSDATTWARLEIHQRAGDAGRSE